MKTKKLFFILFFLAVSCSSSENKTKNSSPSFSTKKEQKTPRNGYYEELFPNGKIWSSCEYKNGKKHGKVTTYYPNGNIRYTGWFKDDKKTDVWLFYNEKGMFAKEINFNKQP